MSNPDGRTRAELIEEAKRSIAVEEDWIARHPDYAPYGNKWIAEEKKRLEDLLEEAAQEERNGLPLATRTKGRCKV